MPISPKMQRSVAVSQLTNPASDLALAPSTAETFFSAFEKVSKSAHVAQDTPLEECLDVVQDFLANNQKEVLFIPLVIKGYRTKIYEEKAAAEIQEQSKGGISSASDLETIGLNSKDELSEADFNDVGEFSSEKQPSASISVKERLISYFRGFIHFLQGGSLENHIVLITVRKKEGGGYEVEYYDPKGRSISNLCQVAGKAADGSVSEHPITEYMEKIVEKTKAGSPIYYHQGRLAADQSIFNRTECGFHVIRRALSIAKPDEKVDKNVSSVAAVALKIVQS